MAEYDREELRRRREAARWSQADIARRMGVYNATVTKWELGRRQCTAPEKWIEAIEYAEKHPKKDVEYDNEELRRRREVSGWSQREIAAHIDVAHSTVAKWEAGGFRSTAPEKWIEAIEYAEKHPKNARAFGENECRSLMKRRRAAGWTRQLLAPRIGVTIGTLLHWELYRRNCSKPKAWVAAVEYAEKHPMTVEYDREELRRRRESAGWSQDAIARHMGLFYSTVSKWERGQNQCTTPEKWLEAIEYAEKHPKGDKMQSLNDQWNAGAWLEPHFAAKAAGVPISVLDSVPGVRRGVINNRTVYKKGEVEVEAKTEETQVNEDTLNTLADMFNQIPNALKNAAARIGLLRKQCKIDAARIDAADARIRELEKETEQQQARIQELEKSGENNAKARQRVEELEKELQFMTEQAESSEAQLAKIKSLIGG